MNYQVRCRQGPLLLLMVLALPLGCATQQGRRMPAELGGLTLAAPPATTAIGDGGSGPVVPASAQVSTEAGGSSRSIDELPPQAEAEQVGQETREHSPDGGVDPSWEWAAINGYLIQPGDLLTIKFRVATEFDEDVIVRPDGRIALQMIGDVMAAYYTPEELRTILESAFTSIVPNPQLAVIVRSFSGNHVFVGGEVQTPGSLAISGRLTTLQAIIQAGGFRDTADRHRVVVRRFGGGWQEFDLQCELHGGTVHQDLTLQPYDVVYVPKSHIAKVNQFVDQYINRVVPFQRSFGFFWTVSGFNPAAAGP